ncbi:MAG: MATE family efflux transporter [Oscillospiraceae bacterium]|nr:MATE family efflux transporter [Oscillospiraceae bacterium]
MAASKDLTTGKPMTLILGFGVPLLFGFLFQQFYNVADTAIVGRFLGYKALAAVGSTGSVNFLVIGFVMGVCSGFSIPIAQMFGAGDFKQLRRYVTNALWLCIFLAAVITALTLIFCTEILHFTNTPEDIFDRARTYIFTIFAGVPAYFLYNMTAGILRSLGDSKTPVSWLVIASIVNIVLDIVFIFFFRLDVFGAALATVIAQFVSGFGCLWRVCKSYAILKPDRDDWTFSAKHIGRLFLMGLPMGLQYSITGIGSVMLQTAVNELGTSYVTAVTAANKLSMFIACPFDAMGSTMATYSGQNVGAQKWERLNKGLGACVLLGAVYAAAAFLFLFFAGNNLAMIFLDEESRHLLPLVKQFLTTLSAFYFPLALVNIVRFFIQGMGFSPTATFAGILEMIGRWSMAHLVRIYGFTAVCFASPTAWVLADLFLIPAYFICKKRLMKKYNALSEASADTANTADGS